MTAEEWLKKNGIKCTALGLDGNPATIPPYYCTFNRVLTQKGISKKPCDLECSRYKKPTAEEMNRWARQVKGGPKEGWNKTNVLFEHERIQKIAKKKVRLAEDKKDRIIKLLKKGKASQGVIADRYGISQARVSQINRRYVMGMKA